MGRSTLGSIRNLGNMSERSYLVSEVSAFEMPGIMRRNRESSDSESEREILCDEQHTSYSVNEERKQPSKPELPQNNRPATIDTQVESPRAQIRGSFSYLRAWRRLRSSSKGEARRPQSTANATTPLQKRLCGSANELDLKLQSSKKMSSSKFETPYFS